MKATAIRKAGRPALSPAIYGFTLIELIVFIAVVPAALLGILVAVNTGIRDAPEPTSTLRRNELAHLYLEEIMSSPYDEKKQPVTNYSCAQDLAGALTSNPCTTCLGPEGEARADYNDVDDYHGLREGRCPADPSKGLPAIDTPLLDARGLPRQGYRGFCVEVDVAYDGNFNGAANEDLGTVEANPCVEGATLDLNLGSAKAELRAKRIRLTLTNPSGAQNRVATYRGGF